MTPLTHLDAEGQAHMVDVGDKAVTARSATAEALILMEAATLSLINEGRAAKGDVMATARLAGIMAAKKTSELIPLCHPLPLTSVEVKLAVELDRSAVRITATCKVSGRTGVEMEALTAASIAALTIYDMVKAVDRGMRIDGVRLLHKTGGRTGEWRA